MVHGAAELEDVAPLVAVDDAVAALAQQEVPERAAQRPARQQHAQQRARRARLQRALLLVLRTRPPATVS